MFGKVERIVSKLTGIPPRSLKIWSYCREASVTANRLYGRQILD
jgi:hypothetical protein